MTDEDVDAKLVSLAEGVGAALATAKREIREQEIAPALALIAALESAGIAAKAEFKEELRALRQQLDTLKKELAAATAELGELRSKAAIYRGQWDGETRYLAGDMVLFSGELHRARGKIHTTKTITPRRDDAGVLISAEVTELVGPSPGVPPSAGGEWATIH